MQIRSAAKWIAAAAGILVGAVIVGFTLKDTTYIEAKLEQIKGARQSVTAVEQYGVADMLCLVDEDSKDAEDKKCGNSERDTPSGE